MAISQLIPNVIAWAKPLRSVAPTPASAENDCVPRRKLSTVFFATLLVLFLATIVPAVPALAQSSAPQAAPKSKPAPRPAAPIDINHASMDELLKVPGMTSSWAGRIIRFRPYRTKRDLLDHGVLPSDVYDRVKDYLIAHRGEQ
jgi:DNA uptake protein ComE-like DNA-binding protein